MKHLVLIVVLSIMFSESYAQNQNVSTSDTNLFAIISSNIGVSGSSNAIIIDNKKYIVSQSIGQASVIGTYSNGGYILRQGYQQPFVRFDKTYKLNNNDLFTIVYPNPFDQTIYISFKEVVLNDVYIYVFDIQNRLIYSQIFKPSQFIELTLSDISKGSYVLKMMSSGKLFNAKLIKK